MRNAGSEPSETSASTSAKAAGAITIVGQITKIAIQFLGMVTLSRLLSPRDFGLMAMLVVFLSLGELIRDFGLLQAAIQTPTLTHGQASNLFWSNTLIGVTMTCGLWLAAPAIAGMYHEPALRSIAPWVALSFSINALQTQFQVRLARDLRFVALTVTDALSQVVGFASGVTAALMGAGYWSLVIQTLAIYSSVLVQRMLIAKWRPGFPRREPGMKRLYSFGVNTSGAQLLHYVAYNTDSYIIGIRWGAGPLGIYNRAFQMFTLPASQLLAPLTNVALPLMSRLRHAGEDFYPLLWKAQVAISAALTFIFLLVGSLANPIVDVILGPVWTESATLLSILSIGGAIQILSNICFWAFLASGNSKQLLLSGLVTRPLLAACIAVGSINGLNGVAWGFSVGLSISWFISLAWLRNCDAMPVSRFLRSGLHVLFCGAVTGMIVWTLINQLDSSISTIALLISGFFVATVIYVPLVLLNAEIRQFLITVGKLGVVRAKSLICQ